MLNVNHFLLKLLRGQRSALSILRVATTDSPRIQRMSNSNKKLSGYPDLRSGDIVHIIFEFFVVTLLVWTPLTDVWYCCFAIRRCVVHLIESKILLTDDSYCMILSFCRTSVCCTPNEIKDPPYRRFILHDFIVVPYVCVLYTQWDQRSSLPTIHTAWFYRCAVRLCVVHPMRSKILLTDDSYCMILSLCRTSVCCTPNEIKDPPYRRFILHDFVVLPYVGVLYTRWDQRSPYRRFILHGCVVLTYVGVLYTRKDQRSPYRRLTLNNFDVVSFVGVL